MLIGYVSDERYVAIADACVDFEQDGNLAASVRSTASGSIHADIPAGAYRVTLAKEGFGSKRVNMSVEQGRPYPFRLLSNALSGYVWPKWVKAGDSGDFRVHSVEPFRLSLWRYGWKREFVRLLGWNDEHGPCAMMQITPDGDYTQTGANWNRQGYSNPHINHLVVAPDRTGLYYLHAETESGKFFAFPWVVAPVSPSAPVAVLASTNTWNAYNNWGGRSNYVNAGGLPQEPVVNARQDLPRYTKGPFTEWGRPDEAFLPLSFERPEPGNNAHRDEEAADSIKGRLQSSLAPGEWRLLAWLERESFSYDYYSEYQLHSGQLDLNAYKVLIFGVHPEYCSREMYERAKAWVHRGGRILYLGGNGVNAEVEYPDESTMRIKSRLDSDGSFSMADPDDPSRIYESRFHR
ncbi:MAG: N,N-dimethylformamidase beta subunit family domain-containing protein, partial [Bryobacteraceae bacterium]